LSGRQKEAARGIFFPFTKKFGKVVTPESGNTVKIAAEIEGKFFLMKMTCGTHSYQVGWAGMLFWGR
jgi:hypothetical protein